ncbi:hypothetical protein L202_07722 [Cryptococcus amylolentus CBS 6039]|uniref:HIT-type domain-containing protein n=1 Tax=Cryptococcus amylolentus CBS 6039 TaxID=1295533 RepID=A0A1E3HBJ4_9TREE|nr:hypothetical protein L202_07722 [Cryptococcus amylolentus CBS 6039]ODN73156.1 hypothetical protein L202_07722 [Cryptococcus amylolentus CBS 6039]
MAVRRNQPRQQAAQNSQTAPSAYRQTDALTEFQTRRLNKRLEELERTNPTDIPASSFVPGNVQAAGLAQVNQPPKKKQTANVRRILYNKKSLNDWLDELPAEPIPPYISAVAPPPNTPPRRICSSCGYVGAYKCPRCLEWSCDMACMAVHERDGGCGIGR